jgi:hypothetical protein
VLKVQGSLGFARHIGQRTDNMCRGVSFEGSTLVLFDIADLRNGQSCSYLISIALKWERSFTDQPFLGARARLGELALLDWLSLKDRYLGFLAGG